MLPALVAFNAKPFFFCQSSWILSDSAYLAGGVSAQRDHLYNDVAVLYDCDVVFLVAEASLIGKRENALVGATVKALSCPYTV
jgi:hypothetical protein